MNQNIKIDNLSSTQSAVNNWMTEYVNLHLKNELSTNTVIGSQSNETFQNFLPIAMKVAAKTICNSLFSVLPMKDFGNSEKEREIIELDVATINRDRKLDSIIEDKEFEEFKEEDHELYKSVSTSNLFYLDYKYSTPSISTNYSAPINKRGKKKRTK